MRGHAKAASVEPSFSRREPQRLTYGSLLALLLLAVAAVALSASTARAATTHPYTGTSFGPDGTSATSFVNLQGLTVDQSGGHVYAYDAGAGKVYKFDFSGTPVNFSGLSGNAIAGVGEAGNGITQIAIAPVGAPAGTAGDIYVANNVAVKIYGPDGTALGQLNGPEPCGVSADPSGHVFVGEYPNTVRELIPTGNPAVDADQIGASTATLPNICNVAADGLGNVYAASYLGFQGVVKLEGLSDASAEPIDPGASTLAVDSATDHLFANRGNLFAEYSAAGNLLGISGADRLSSSFGIAIDSDTKKVYAGNGASGQIDVFGPSIVVPGLNVEAPTQITGKKAVLHATVNPAGLAVSDCKFEYGTTTAYGNSKPCDGVIPADEADHPVDAELSNLTPGTEYHFRLSATNANGTARSVDQTFATGPLADTREATGVTPTKATLNGAVFPEGDAVTDCKFEYGTTENLGTSIPCEGAIPTDEGEHPVDAALTGLESYVSYYFRIVVENANGIGRGSIRSFTTEQLGVTEPVTDITGTKATLHGTVSPYGETIIDCRFEYGFEASFDKMVPCEGSIPADENEHQVTAQLTHLIPNISKKLEYRARLVVSTAAVTYTAFAQSFGTADVVITGPVTGVAPPNATATGTVNPEGMPVTECYFEYGRTSGYGSKAPCLEDEVQIGSGVSAVAVHADLSPIDFGAVYHYRLSIVNEDGVTRGEDKSFQTDGPLIESEWSVDVNQRQATLKASINPQGGTTTYHVDYGTDTSYGQSTPEGKVGSDGTGHVVFESLDGLTPGVTYHYRFVATGPGLVSEGGDQTFTTYPVPSGQKDDCPNQVFRSGASASLPDCRAYEMVSPVDKNGGDIKTLVGHFDFPARLEQSSLDGNRFAYSSVTAFGDSQSAPWTSEYVATRVDGKEWISKPVSPPRESGGITYASKFGLGHKAFSSDLSDGWLFYDSNPPLDPCAAPGIINLYRQDLSDGSYEALITAEPQSMGFEPPVYLGASADGNHAVFIAQAKLTNDAADGQGYQIYEHVRGPGCGQLRLVSVLPNGQPSTDDYNSIGKGFGTYLPLSNVEHAVSADGSRIIWGPRGGGSKSPLYVRVDGNETIEIAAADAAFVTAAEDGSRVIYSRAGSLYEFDVDRALAEEPARTLIAGGITARLERGGLAASSADASRIYFVSTYALNQEGETGEPNLYFREVGGETRLVATLSKQDTQIATFFPLSIDSSFPISKATRSTPDGKHVTFVSVRNLTGYDNTSSIDGRPALEVYLYDSEAEELSCISCNPTGSRPQGRLISIDNGVERRLAAKLATASTQFAVPNSLSRDGNTLFFESFEALLPRDTNGAEDVYEWERAESQAQCDAVGAELYVSSAGGCLSLISSGQSPIDSELTDASPDGTNAFIRTASSLLPQDPDQLDIYDVRVGGGLPQPATPSANCEGEACQGPAQPPRDPTPASATFQGAGNVSQGRHARCGRKAKLRKRCKSKKHRGNAQHAKQRAGREERAGR